MGRNSKNGPKQPDFVGIKNIGNTCFLNCVLQQIHMAPKVRDAVLAIKLTSTISPERKRGKVLWWNHSLRIGGILDYETNNSIKVNQAGAQVEYLTKGQEVEYEVVNVKYSNCAKRVTVVSTEEKDDDTYLYHLQNILKALDDKDEDIKTSQLCNSFKWISYTSGYAAQADVHGFFCALFQRIDDEKVNKLLRVKVIKTHLLKCKHLYTANEDLFALSIPMGTADGTPALSALLDAYFEKDDRKKKCFECGSKTQEGKIMKYLENTPEILCIHINRIDGVYTEDIEVDTTLDISNLMPPEEKDNCSPSREDVKISYVENILPSSSSGIPKTSLLSCRQFTFAVELDRSKGPRKITILGLPRLRDGITELKSVKNFEAYPTNADTCVVIIDNQETTINWARIGEKNVVEFQVNIQTRSNVVTKVEIVIDWQDGGHARRVDPEGPAPRRRYCHYSLAGLLIHNGYKNGGHYVSQIKCRKGPHKGTWWEFDDRSVKKIVGGIEEEPSRMKCGAVMAIYEPTPPDQLPRKSSTSEQPLKAAGETQIDDTRTQTEGASENLLHLELLTGSYESKQCEEVSSADQERTKMNTEISQMRLEITRLGKEKDTLQQELEQKNSQAEVTEGQKLTPEIISLRKENATLQQELEHLSELLETNKQIDPILRKFLEMGNLLQYENYFKKNGWTFDVLKDKFLSQNDETQFDEDGFFDAAGISNREEQRIFKLLLTYYPEMKESLVRLWTKWKQQVIQKLGGNNEAEICLQGLMLGDVCGDFVRKDDAPGSATV